MQHLRLPLFFAVVVSSKTCLRVGVAVRLDADKHLAAFLPRTDRKAGTRLSPVNENA